MKFAVALFVALCTAAGSAIAGLQDFKFVDEIASAATVRTERYAFNVVTPHSAYLKERWKRYYDPTTDSTTLVMSLTRQDSYALTVTPVRIDGQFATPEEMLRVKYPDDAATPMNEHCAASDWSKPTRLAPNMVVVTAACMFVGTDHAYELTISWLSGLLRGDGESASDDLLGDVYCGGTERGFCKGRFAELGQSMKVFVNSFRTVGRR